MLPISREAPREKRFHLTHTARVEKGRARVMFYLVDKMHWKTDKALIEGLNKRSDSALIKAARNDIKDCNGWNVETGLTTSWGEVVGVGTLPKPGATPS